MSRGGLFRFGDSAESCQSRRMNRRPDVIEWLLIAALVATTLLTGLATIRLTLTLWG